MEVFVGSCCGTGKVYKAFVSNKGTSYSLDAMQDDAAELFFLFSWKI